MLLNLAAESHDLFANSTTEQKRQLVNFVFANLELKGTTLCYTLKKSFDQMLNLTDCKLWRAPEHAVRTFYKIGQASSTLEKWRARQDSNLRPLPPEGSALSTELRAPSQQVKSEYGFIRLQ